MALEMHNSLHVHPGEWLRSEMIAAHGSSVNEAADHLGVTHHSTFQQFLRHPAN